MNKSFLFTKIIFKYFYISLFLLTYSGCVGIDANYTKVSKDTSSWNQTKYDLLRHYGEPDSKDKISENTEKWTYDNELHFSGIIIWIGIPIPLMVPTGYHYNSYIIKDEIRIIDAEQARHYKVGTNCTCNWITGHPRPFKCGCYSGGYEDTHISR